MKKRLVLWAAMAVALLAAGCDVSVSKCATDDCGLGWDDVEMDGSTPSEQTDAAKPDASIVDGAVDASGIDAAPAQDGSLAADASTTDASGPVTDQGFCDTRFSRANAWQSFFDNKCGCLSPQDVSDRDYFLVAALLFDDQSNVACLNEFSSLTTRAAGAQATLTYDPSKAAACAASYAEQFAAPPADCARAANEPGFDVDLYEGLIGHGAQPLAQLASCRAAFAGKVAQGGSCTDSFDCAGELRCRPIPGVGADGGVTLQCQPARGTGEECSPQRADCQTGLTCARATGSASGFQCIEVTQLRLNGGVCSTSRDCATGLLCDCPNDACACGAFPPVPAGELICQPLL